MTGNTTPRDYVVTLRLQKVRQPPSATDPIERLEVTAYDYNEAIVQGIIMLNARLGGLADHGLQAEIVNVEPDCAKTAARSADLIEQIRFVLMAPGGTA